MNQVQRAKDGRVEDNQREYRDHEMTRPWFFARESVSDERYENSDDGNERGSDVQPFSTRHAFTAHDVWPDVENREQDRQIHSGGGQRRTPGQNSDRERLLYFCHWK